MGRRTQRRTPWQRGHVTQQRELATSGVGAFVVGIAEGVEHMRRELVVARRLDQQQWFEQGDCGLGLAVLEEVVRMVQQGLAGQVRAAQRVGLVGWRQDAEHRLPHQRWFDWQQRRGVAAAALVLTSGPAGARVVAARRSDRFATEVEPRQWQRGPESPAKGERERALHVGVVAQRRAGWRVVSQALDEPGLEGVVALGRERGAGGVDDQGLEIEQRVGRGRRLGARHARDSGKMAGATSALPW